MRLFFKVIMAFFIIIMINSILCQISEGIKARVTDKSNTSTDVDNFTIEVWHDYISIQNGYTITHIPFKNIKEIDFSWQKGKQFAAVSTTNGRTATGMVEYVGWNEIQGDTEFGPLHLQLNDTKKIIFNSWSIPASKVEALDDETSILITHISLGSGFARSLSNTGETTNATAPGYGFAESIENRSNVIIAHTK